MPKDKVPRRRLGGMGKFPDGKLTPDDEGELRIAVHTFEGNIVMQFGTDVSWVGMQPALARQIAKTLNALADQLDPPIMNVITIDEQ